MSEGTPEEIRCTPTDPSLEYDLYEVVRLRVADAVERRGYGRIEAERVALYMVEATRPVAHLLRALSRIDPPDDDEVVGAIGKVLDELDALERARRILLRVGTEE